MSEIKSKASITGQVVLILSEEEARALDAIVGYGPKLFVEWFYKTHGKHYLKPHENGMVSLFDTCRQELPRHLKKFDDARSVFKGERIASFPKVKVP